MDALLTTLTGEISAHPGTLQAFGNALRQVTERAVFRIYQARRPEATQRTQGAALIAFAQFLQLQGHVIGNLAADPHAWQFITADMARLFQEWLFQDGYAMGTINGYVSSVKVYMTLANQAGFVPDGEILRLQGIRGYTRKEATDQDAKREKQGMTIRKGAKKAQAVLITEEQARALCKVRNDTPQARRDALMMCLLIDHGLRVSELASLKIEDIDIEAKQMTFYRQKTGKTSRHNLRGRAWQSLIEYLNKDQRAQSGPLMLGSSKSGALILGKGLTTRAINQRVNQLGRLMGLENLSPHDCRHHGATKAGNDPRVSLAGLMSWGGWDSPQSAARYINKGQADNDGVSLGMD